MQDARHDADPQNYGETQRHAGADPHDSSSRRPVLGRVEELTFAMLGLGGSRLNPCGGLTRIHQANPSSRTVDKGGFVRHAL
jgi:hypothetical protein